MRIIFCKGIFFDYVMKNSTLFSNYFTKQGVSKKDIDGFQSNFPFYLALGVRFLNTCLFCLSHFFQVVPTANKLWVAKEECTIPPLLSIYRQQRRNVPFLLIPPFAFYIQVGKEECIIPHLLSIYRQQRRNGNSSVATVDFLTVAKEEWVFLLF